MTRGAGPAPPDPAGAEGWLAACSTAAARSALDRLTGMDLSDGRLLTVLAALRRDFAPDTAAAVLTLARLRRRAAVKFPRADAMFFTAESLEQATAWPVAVARAERLDALAPDGPVLDLGCGIGGDTLALAGRRDVIAYERDAERLALARANAEALGVAARIAFRHADWTADLDAGRLPAAAAAFVDPARRVAGRRVFRPADLVPPLATVLRLCDHVPVLAVKLMPGIDAADLPDAAGLELVSHDRVCKEAVLWLPPPPGMARWATVHRPDGSRHTLAAAGARAPVGDLATPCVLYEPDPAVIRAGAVAELCGRLGGHLFDPQIAYVVARRAQPTPFAEAFRVLEAHRFGLKALNRRIAALGFGRLEIKRRGFPIEPEALRARLRPSPGGRDGVVILTRRGDTHLALLGERVQREVTPPSPARSDGPG
ncbi:SAM-dependent methyltransferase [bacterium]|nr:MAG: SAM-dependent methyltransferase [bacterium]